MSNGRSHRRRLGRPYLYLLPVIPDRAPTALKDALGARNAASVSGKCGCGATGRVSGPDRDGLLHMVFEHEADCPAHDRALAALMDRRA